MATVIIATATVTMTTMMMTDAVRDKSGVPHSQRGVAQEGDVVDCDREGARRRRDRPRRGVDQVGP